MPKHILTALMIGLVAFAVSCSGPKKKEDKSEEPGSSITTEDINLDPKGSDGGNIEGLTTIQFDYDSSTLTSAARQSLAANAEWIRNHPQYTIQIEGHCDSRGSIEYNLALGERRAKAVKNYLVSLGVDPKNLTIISYGEEKPLSFGDSDADHAKNRRANFVPMKN